jgi:SAM-dependent methyltransferase
MSKTILEDIVSHYNKEIGTNQGHLELEIRYKNVNYQNFVTIYNYLLENTDVSETFITKMVSSLMKQKNGINQLQTTNIRDIYFDSNNKSFKKEYNSKTPILIPYKEYDTYGLFYSVSLSLEKSNILPFINDESAIIRIKNRISFIIHENKYKWRVDMSVIRQILGSNKDMLKKMTDQMFNQPLTIDNLSTIFNEEKISQKIYKYEVEIELVSEEKVTSQDILNIAKKILYVANPDYMSENILQNKIYEIAKYLVKAPGILIQYQKNYGLKQLLPKVQALTRYDYRSIYPIYGYYLTDKADGIRAVGICNTSGGYIVSDILTVIESITNEEILDTIVDAEYVNEVLYVFDLIAINGQNVSMLNFEQRLSLLPNAVENLKSIGIKAELKHYAFISDNIEHVIKSVYNQQRPYNIDGLIFVKPGDNYLQTKSYKWKTIEDNTIDFLVKKAPNNILGQKPYITKNNHTLYFLFVGINNNLFQALGLHKCPGYNNIFDDVGLSNSKNNLTYFPIQFSPSTAPLAYIYYHPDSSILNIENNVVEFRCTDNCSGNDGPLVTWSPIRIRRDRQKDLDSKIYYGNDYKIAEITWINYMDPFPLEQLWLNVTDDYFAGTKSGIYNAQTGVLSFLKFERIKSFSRQNWIIDIGSGKGQDLGRYFTAKIKNLIAIDNDKASLAELIRRKYTFAKDNFIKQGSTNVYVILADMTINHNLIIDKITDVTNIPKEFIDVIVCNLSIHYYIYTNELLNNFINFVNHLLKPDGGILVITCFIGENIHKLLKNIKEGDTWTKYQNEVIKYSIKKMYSSNTLENMGQKIGVLLPFSDGQYYEEYLVNTTYLIKELNKYDITLLTKSCASDILPDFKQRNHAIHANLTEDDITYLGLYGELVFTKNKTKKHKK